MIGINSNLNWFSWFVTFYIYAMIVMPFFGRLIDRCPGLYASIFISLSFICEVALHELYPDYSTNDWTQRLFDCLLQTPCMILGYVFARKQWFQSVELPTSKCIPFCAAIIMIGVLFLRRHLSSLLGFNMDFFYAPLFILALLVIINRIGDSSFMKVLSLLGKTSVYMWFFHALFFTDVTRSVYQPLVTISDSFCVVTLWTTFLTFVCSWGIMNIEGRIEKLVTKKIAA